MRRRRLRLSRFEMAQKSKQLIGVSGSACTGTRQSLRHTQTDAAYVLYTYVASARLSTLDDTLCVMKVRSEQSGCLLRAV